MKKLLIVLLFILLLFSCNKEKEGLSVALSQEPPVLDSAINSSISTRLITVGNIYEKLLTLDESGNIVPFLASFWEVTNENKKITFTLRNDVLFHNGEKLKAEDVVASMNRWLALYNPALTLTGGNIFIKESDNTVTITSDNSLLFLPLMIASSPQSAIIVPESTILDNTTLSSFIGTGPYALIEWIPGEKIELASFQEYWGKEVKIKNITYYFVSDAVTRTLGLENGLYDAINDTMDEDKERLKNKGFNVMEGDESGSIALVFNKKEGLCTTIEMREAIAFSLDRSSLMKACYGSSGFSLHSDYMEKEQNVWRIEDTNIYKDQDKVKAKELVEKYYNGETVRILSSNLSNLDKIALTLSSELEEVGIKTDLLITDWVSFLEKRKDSSSWDIYISSFSTVPYPGMKSYLSPSFPGWIKEDDKAYLSLQDLNKSLTLEEASAKWQETQSLLWETLPIYIAGHYTTSYTLSPRLKGVLLQNGIFFWDAELI